MFLSMKHLDLFSGIGGFALAARWMGWETVQFVEIDEFCQKVLKKNFPNVPIFGDITQFDGTKYKGTIDILTGGFPCQPFSVAGKRKGIEDDRYFWPEMLRTIREIQPRYIVAENVSGLVNWNWGMVFNKVQADLEAQGYEVLPFLLPACAVNAYHRRDRIWIIAHSGGRRLQTCNSEFRQINGIPKTTSIEFARNPSPQWDKRKRSSGMLRRNYGIPQDMDGITFSKWRKGSIKGFGNAIVPQVALEIFKAIEKHNK
jgi:DNA (cytosine-5)-methyltransferase 1